MVYTATSLTTASVEHFEKTTFPKRKDSRISPLNATFSLALEHARRLTAMFGTDNPETAIAWETVEELSKAGAFLTAPADTLRDTFIRYCEENPDAPEARIYDN